MTTLVSCFEGMSCQQLYCANTILVTQAGIQNEYAGRICSLSSFINVKGVAIIHLLPLSSGK